MKSAEFRVQLAVAGRLARAELKDCPRTRVRLAERGGAFTIVLSTEYSYCSVLSTQH